jgi:hypothetical protein
MPSKQRQHSQGVVAGDNAWRYQQEMPIDKKKDDDLMVELLETHGGHLATPQAVDEWAELSISANVLSLAQRLQIPHYLTGEEEPREEHVISKETAATSQDCGDAAVIFDDRSDTTGLSAAAFDACDEELQVEPNGDLDAWLDSVIS